MIEPKLLDLLTWQEFQSLCQDLLKARFGPSIRIIGGPSDKGREAFCGEPLEYVVGQKAEGPHLFQVKHTQGANFPESKPYPKLRAQIKEECESITKRKEKGHWTKLKEYVLLTNVPFNDEMEQEVKGLIHDVDNNPNVRIWWGKDICSELADFPNVRSSYPLLFGPTEWSRFVRTEVTREITQASKLTLSEAKRLSLVFITTRTFRRAWRTLKSHNFTALTGPPESGKTANARMIGLALMNQGWKCFETPAPSDILKVHDDKEPQIFIVDDSFGRTQYRPSSGAQWEKSFHQVLEHLDQKHWMIWTSRTAPFNKALRDMDLPRDRASFSGFSDVQVDALDLTTEERAYILFKHCKHHNFNVHQKNWIKHFARPIALDPHFTPERARNIASHLPEILAGNAFSYSTADPHWKLVYDELTIPTETMMRAFRQLDEEEQYLLMALLDNPESNITIKMISDSYERLTDSKYKIAPVDVIQMLNGQFIRTLEDEDGAAGQIMWCHPSIADSVIISLQKDSKLRELFLKRCWIFGLSLALSTGGGRTGERNLPLLCRTSDWEILEAKSEEVLKSCDFEDISRLIYVLDDVAKAVLVEPDHDPHCKHDGFKRILGKSLLVIRSRWNASQYAIAYKDLKLYKGLSMFIHPFPPAPDLMSTWRATIGSDHTLKRGVDFKEWLDLAELIKSLEPRFLESVGYPNRYNRLVEQFLFDDFEYEVGKDNVIESFEDLTYENDKLESAQRLLSWILRRYQIAEDVEKHAQELVESREDYLRDVDDDFTDQGELEPDYDYDDDHYLRGDDPFRIFNEL